MEVLNNAQSLPSKGPITGPTPESKMHKAAETFVGTFFAQMVEEMFNETAESSEESSFETEMYGSWLAEGMGKKIAESGSSKHMVHQVENMMRRQAGLDEIKTSPSTAQANGTYKNMNATLTMKESNNVCATAA